MNGAFNSDFNTTSSVHSQKQKSNKSKKKSSIRREYSISVHETCSIHELSTIDAQAKRLLVSIDLTLPYRQLSSKRVPSDAIIYLTRVVCFVFVADDIAIDQ